ncbi:hypothetical protein ACTQ45_01870 [Fundicoccus sp. Sow4_D5]
MLHKLAKEGYQQLALSIQKANRAVTLYHALGFGVHSEDEETKKMGYFL